QVGCEQCKGPHYTKDCPLKEEGKTLEEAYYTQFSGPFQGGGYRATTLGYYQRNNQNPSYQERRKSMEDTLSKFMSESTKRHEENSNLIKEIRATTDAAIRNQGASIKTLEIQIGKMSKVLQERGFGSLPSSTETNPRDQVNSISTTIEANSYSICRIGSSQYAVSTRQNSTLLYKSRQTTVPFPSRASVSVMPLSTYLNLGLGELAHTRLIVELADRTVKYPKGIAKNVLVGIGKFTFPVDFIILDMPEDIKVPLILGRPFLSTASAKIDVYKRKITLRVREERIVFSSVKPTSSLIKRVYMLNYIELNNLNEPFELRRNQGDDLMPTVEEGEVIEEFRTRDEDLDIGIDDYPIFHMAKQIIPVAQLVPKFQGTGRCNSYVVLQSIPCLPECKIVGQILLDHPLGYALTATANVPAVYLQQFWKTVSKVHDTKDTIRFKLDAQEITYTVDMFRDALKLPVKTLDNPFITPVNIEIIESFIQRVDYQGVVDKVSAFYTKFLAQPWQTMFKVSNRCLTTRTSGHDQTKINILQLFHVLVNLINVDYVAFLWWDFTNCVFQKKVIIQSSKTWRGLSFH
ncbi:DNA-directed DNA polymerase, partial [Tanacetum coccineum]